MNAWTSPYPPRIAFTIYPVFPQPSFSVDFRPENIDIKSIYNEEGDNMETAKLFQNGSSQAVRLPKAFRNPVVMR